MFNRFNRKKYKWITALELLDTNKKDKIDIYVSIKRLTGRKEENGFDIRTYESSRLIVGKFLKKEYKLSFFASPIGNCSIEFIEWDDKYHVSFKDNRTLNDKRYFMRKEEFKKLGLV